MINYIINQSTSVSDAENIFKDIIGTWYGVEELDSVLSYEDVRLHLNEIAQITGAASFQNLAPGIDVRTSINNTVTFTNDFPELEVLVDDAFNSMEIPE